jgi:hypothetical protein
MATEEKLIKIHKKANELKQKEYRNLTISIHDVAYVVQAIEQLSIEQLAKKSRKVKP